MKFLRHQQIERDKRKESTQIKDTDSNSNYPVWFSDSDSYDNNYWNQKKKSAYYFFSLDIVEIY